MADGEGGFVVAWHDSRNSPLPEIYAQRVNAEGTPLWGTGGVAVAVDLGWQTNPRLVMNSEGNIIISFYNELNFHDTMKAQKLSLSGEVLWPTNGVLVSSYGGGIAEVTADQRGGCILV